MATKVTTEQKKNSFSERFILIGWREWIYLPSYKNFPIKAKIDTGARTSALHAASINEYKKGHQNRVRFELAQKNLKIDVDTKLLKHVKIINSFGGTEIRPLVNLKIKLGHNVWNTYVTLTKRAKLTYPMLVGRNTLKKRYIIHSKKSYLTGKYGC